MHSEFEKRTHIMLLLNGGSVNEKGDHFEFFGISPTGAMIAWYGSGIEFASKHPAQTERTHLTLVFKAFGEDPNPFVPRLATPFPVLRHAKPTGRRP
jgi:hypothetical protein